MDGAASGQLLEKWNVTLNTGQYCPIVLTVNQVSWPLFQEVFHVVIVQFREGGFNIMAVS
jgi:hypothetical protein